MYYPNKKPLNSSSLRAFVFTRHSIQIQHLVYYFKFKLLVLFSIEFMYDMYV